MASTIETTLKTNPNNVIAVVNYHTQRDMRVEFITWLILGGKNFLPSRRVSVFDFLIPNSKKVPRSSLANIAAILCSNVPDVEKLLDVSCQTSEYKKETETLNTLTSSLCIEIANTLAVGSFVFEDNYKLNRWLRKGNRALNGLTPYELLNSPTGLKLINQVLFRIEDGIYS